MIITIGRKPFKGSVSENILECKTGAINIDLCRISNVGDSNDKRGTSRVSHKKGIWSSEALNNTEVFGNGFGGRFPTNLFLTTDTANILGKQSGVRTSGGGDKRPKKGSSLFFGSDHVKEGVQNTKKSTGTADRFFKVIQE